MKNKQTVTFLNCFDSFAAAQEHAMLIKDATIVLHMYYGDKELFAVCDQNSVDEIVDALALEAKPKPCETGSQCIGGKCFECWIDDEMCENCDCWKKTREMCS